FTVAGPLDVCSFEPVAAGALEYWLAGFERVGYEAVQIRDFAEIERVGPIVYLAKWGESVHDVLLYGGFESVPEDLPALGHAGGVVPDVVLLHDVSEKAGASLGDREALVGPCVVALVPFFAPFGEFAAEVFGTA